MTLKTFTTLVLVTLFLVTLSQNKVDGDDYFESLKYAKAIGLYEKEIEKGDTGVLPNLAVSYRKLDYTKQAEESYHKLIESGSTASLDKYYYSEMLRANGKKVEAHVWMKKYLEEAPDDLRAQSKVGDYAFLDRLAEESDVFTVSSFLSTQGNTYFSPTYVDDKNIAFISPYGNTQDGLSKLKNYDIYTCSVSEEIKAGNIRSLSKKINSKLHEGSMCFRSNGAELYFTRNIYNKSQNAIIPSIYYSSKGDKGKWSTSKRVNIPVDKQYIVNHPAVTQDGKTLYFSSNLPEGKGGMDLYKTEKGDDGSWSTPVNLGSKINTAGNEVFPVIYSEDLLSFSSDGHPGLGGLDLFVCQLNNSSAKPNNLGAPVNSIKDDFSLVLDPSKTKGFFTSSRTDLDNIYSLESTMPLTGAPVRLSAPDQDGDGVIDSEDKCPTIAGKVSLNGCLDSDNDGVSDIEDKCPTVAGVLAFAGCPDSDGDGVADSEDKCPEIAGLKAFSGCADSDNDGVSDYDDKCPDAVGVIANKGCPEVKEEVKEIFEKALKGIQFYSGKHTLKPTSFSILNEVATVMKENTSYNLEMTGYTDSAGDEYKNLFLSRRRAKAAYDYLVDKGIDGSRMSHQGYGDADPVATNLTKEGRAKNRRVEFKVAF